VLAAAARLRMLLNVKVSVGRWLVTAALAVNNMTKHLNNREGKDQWMNRSRYGTGESRVLSRLLQKRGVLHQGKVTAVQKQPLRATISITSRLARFAVSYSADAPKSAPSATLKGAGSYSDETTQSREAEFADVLIPSLVSKSSWQN
jgi:hypothetical protein